MKFQHLRYFVAVVDAGFNVTVAAEKLYATQPGVSKALSAFEDELGFALFVRKGKAFAELTAPAREVLIRARRILQEVDNIKAIAADWRRDDEGELRIATSHTQARYVLPKTIAAFRKDYPKIAVHILQGETAQIADWIARGEADLAIASGEADEFKQLQRFDCFSWQRVAVVPRDHPLTQLGRALTLADLSAYPLVSYASSTRADSSLQKAFREAKLPLQLAFSARDADVIKTYVREGLGVGLIAAMAFDSKADSDLVSLSTDGVFAAIPTWIGLKSDAILRKHTLDFITRFAPHLEERNVLAALGAEDFKTVMYYI